MFLQIYLASKLVPCVRVQAGDRMGIYQESRVGAVSYAFDASQPSALVYQAPDGEELRINDTIEFDTLLFPYDISVQAYIHTGMLRRAR